MTHIATRNVIEDFNAARQAMMREWRALCRAGLAQDDAAEEAKATASAMRQIAAVEGN